MKIKNLLLCISFLLNTQLSNAQPSQLWGLAAIGGVNGEGTIITADSSGNNFQAVYSFVNATGARPWGNLVMANNGKLYGVTEQGGFSNSCVIFSYDPVTNIYTSIYDYAQFPQYGWGACSGLTAASNGILYGLTSSGGANNGGVIYSVDPATDTYQDIYDFSYTTGIGPCGGLLQLSNSLLYGLTSIGGAHSAGTIFSFNPSNNNFVKLYDLIDSTGKDPQFTNLIQATNGILYGMTQMGGMYNKGVIFSFDLSINSYIVLHNFNGINGDRPSGSLMQASSGVLYGMTPIGGAFSIGVIFSYNINTNTYTKLFDFNGTNGSYPMRSFTQASNGKLYGTANSGGLYNIGVIFSFDISNNIYTNLFDFDGTNGASPNGDIIEIFPSSTSIEAMIQNSNVDIFPNPVNNLLTLFLNKSDNISIFNLLGETVIQKNFSSNEKQKVELDVSLLSPGIYFIKVGNEVRKFVKQ